MVLGLYDLEELASATSGSLLRLLVEQQCGETLKYFSSPDTEESWAGLGWAGLSWSAFYLSVSRWEKSSVSSLD